MGYSEFPHSDYQDYDFHEWIRTYKELLDKYSNTLKQIEDTNSRLDKYIADMNAQISNISNTIIPEAVKKGIDAAMAEYANEIAFIKRDIATLQNDFTNYMTATDQQINALHLKIDKLIRQLDDKIDSVRITLLNQINEVQNLLNDKIDNSVTELNQAIENVQSEIIVRDNAVLVNSKEYTDIQIKALQAEIDKLQAATDGRAIRWLWDNGCNFGGYDAMQWYRDTTITAEDWHNAKFTCIDWYVRGREVFHWWHRKNKMFNPFTGRWDDVRTVIQDICDYLKPTPIHAGKYDSLEVTAEEYERLQLDAFEYDFYGGEKINV